jgi:signal transduction histidine kinase/CHASE2 domain-containing sensor protein
MIPSRATHWHRIRDGLLVGAVAAAIVLLLWTTNWFNGLRLSLTDLYYVQHPTSDTVVIVGIDNQTFDEYGSILSWSRELYGDLLNTLVADEARVVAFDLLFAEVNEGDREFAAVLQEAEEAGTRTILTISGVEQLSDDGANVTYSGELRPVTRLAREASYLAYANSFADVNGSIRYSVSSGIYGENERLSFSLAAYLAYFRVSQALVPQVMTVTDSYIELPNVTLPTLNNGLWMHNYFGSSMRDGTFPIIPFQDVLAGDVPAGTFADKIVLVGLVDVTGAVDRYPTPISRFGEMMPGVEIQAHAIETLLQNKALQFQGRVAEVAIIVGLALLTGALCAYVRWYWMFLVGLALMIVWGFVSSIIFSTQQIIPNPLHPTLAAFVATLGSVGSRISTEVLQRRRVESLLTSLIAVSEQRLSLTKIGTLIANDVKQITDAERGTVWALAPHGSLDSLSVWGGIELERELSVGAFREGETRQSDRALAVPIPWQGRILGVLTVMNTPKSRATRQELERFAGRLGASMDNALLYRQTDQQNQLLNRILLESPTGIIVLDASLNVLRWNEVAATWLGLQQVHKLEGQPISFILEQSVLDLENWELIGQLLLAKASFRREVKLARRIVQWDAAHIENDGRWIITLSDITELAELEQVKTRMIRMASHDLKNPLGRIIGYGELMQEISEEEGHGDEYGTYIDRILTSSQEMLNIITEILNLEHIRAGKLNREPLNMALIVREVITRLEGDFEKKKQTLNTDLQGGLPIIVGDYTQLTQAITNLIGNASKYTPDDGTITVTLKKQDGNIRLVVKDNGYGMSQEAQTKLFTAFYRVDNPKLRHIEGTGLGLSLVKAVVEAHQGKVAVESEEGVGSTFSVDLPIEVLAYDETDDLEGAWAST